MKYRQLFNEYKNNNHKVILDHFRGKNFEALAAKYLNLLGASLLQENKNDDAFRVLTIAQKKDPKSLEIINNLSEACNRTHKIDLAYELWDKVRPSKLQPKYLLNKGIIEFRYGKVMNAKRTLLKFERAERVHCGHHEYLMQALLQAPEIFNETELHWLQSERFLFRKSLTSKAIQLIGQYLNGEDGECRNSIKILKSEGALKNLEVMDDKDRVFISAYKNFIDNLLITKRDNLSGDLFNVVGESHSLSFHGQKILVNDRFRTFKANIILGAKIKHFLNIDNSQYQFFLTQAIKRLTGLPVIFIFGEIDFREGEYLLTSPNLPTSSDLKSMATGYIEFLMRSSSPFGVIPIIATVPYPLRQAWESLRGYEIRKSLIREYNRNLVNCARGVCHVLDTFEFIDMMEEYDGKFHIDSRHYSPSIIDHVKFCRP